jgi:hypothetical protein
MSTPRPTPQGISRLLAKAGFERSTHGRPGVSYDQVSTGFVVWKTFHQDDPEHPYVAVQHDVSGMFGDRSDEGWAAYLTEARARLEDYAACLRTAGYAAFVRDRGGEPPWLHIMTAVTAREDQP